jgi:DNA-binding CsgD family transcriptional regulator/PAS domain-containing protein
MTADIDPEKLADVIGKFYDSAIDPSLWPAALESACALVDGTFGCIALFDTRNRTLQIPTYFGGDEELIRRFKSLVPIMPFWDFITQYQLGEIAYNQDLLNKIGMTEAQLEETEFFREWARPYNLCDVMAGIVVKAGGVSGAIHLHTPPTRDMIGPDDLKIMELLLPHARRAITIGKLLDMKSIAEAALDATLDALSSAVILVDANGRVLHSNRAAQLMFSATRVIAVQNGELLTHHVEATNALKAAIGHAASDETELGYGGIGVPLRGDDQDPKIAPSIAHVLPLKSGKLRPGLSLGAVAAVFITGPAEITPPFEALAALYDLTPAEARVLVEIASGKNRVESAAALGIADSTVKTHLARIFEKTATSEQSELTRLVARLTLPIAPRSS